MQELTNPLSDPLDLEYPLIGRCLVQNSPADRVPSHGTTQFATAYAIDFVPVDESGRSASLTIGSLLRPEPPGNFIGFGRPVFAPIRGTVAAARDSEVDHVAFRGLPSIRYAFTQRRRADGGWPALAGNHIMIRGDDGAVALCHLQRHSLSVRIGQAVEIGEEIGRCGNSGNSTEPHLHIQAIDDVDIERASALRITFRGSLPSNGEIVTM